MIPPPLLKYASLDKDVVVVGARKCLEVWNRAAYAAHNESALGRFPEIVESLGHTA